MDGTIHLSGNVFDGAPEAIARMRQQGKVFFVTNSVWFTRKQQAEKLRKMGIDCTEDEIYTGATVAVDYLNTNFALKRVFVLGTEELVQELIASGVDVVDGDPDVVVVSFDDKLTFDKLVKTCDFIRVGVPYYVTHPDFNYPVKGGYLPDSGANLALVRASTGKEPIAIGGKPNKPLADGILGKLGVAPSEVAMLGDRWMTDIEFENTYGFVSVLVLTGEAKLTDPEAVTIKADVVLNSISEF